MNNNSTLTKTIYEYEFKEFISDEDLLNDSNVFANMEVKISKRILQSILNYSKALEVRNTDWLQSQIILN
ncbi:MAG: hypothetical protein KAG64_03300 [Bacteroidales bacterium]|nr:hypothetical protein [Bacteroidales bacterium]